MKRKTLETKHDTVKLPRNLTREEDKRAREYFTDTEDTVYGLRHDDATWYICFDENKQVERVISPDALSSIF